MYGHWMEIILLPLEQNIMILIAQISTAVSKSYIQCFLKHENHIHMTNREFSLFFLVGL